MTARVFTALTLFALLVPAEARAQGGWAWPVEGAVVTAYRNGSDPYASGQHRGIDLAAPAGTRVAAATGGTVTFAGSVGSAGLTVSVRTADGRFDTSYLHLGSAAVARGAHVDAGDPIGTVGASGRGPTAGPHLHFGVRSAGSRHDYHDPLTLLPPPSAERRAPRAAPLAAPEPGAEPAHPLPAPLLPPAAPGPLPAPAPLAAVPPPAAAPRPLPGGAPRPAPAPAPLPAGARLPAPAPAPLAAPASPGRAASQPRQVGGTERAPDWAAVLDRPPIRWSGQDGGPEARARPGAAGPARARGRGGVERGGVDLGWLAACAGLVAAAFLLARPAGPVRALRASSIATCPTTSPRRSTT